MRFARGRRTPPGAGNEPTAAPPGPYAASVRDFDGLLLGLFAALLWGSTDVVATVVSRRIGTLRATAFTQLVALVVLVIAAAVTGIRLPADPWIAARAVACGALSAVAYLAFFSALRIGPLSVVSPVVSVYGALTVVLSVVLLGESLGPLQALGAVVATTGVVLVSIVFERDWRRTRIVGRGVAYAIVALLAFAVVTIALSGAIRAAGWLPILLIARLANASSVSMVLGVSLLRGRRARMKAQVSRPVDAGLPFDGPALPIVPIAAAGGEVTLAERAGGPDGISLDRRVLGLVVLAGALDIGGFIAFAIGLGIAPTWLVGLASSFGPVVAVGAGVTLFGERPRLVQWGGLGLVLGSVFLIALG